jgi:hypothetical protein
MKHILFSLLVLIGVSATAQVYDPTKHTPSNKAYGVAQAAPTDARSMYYDTTLFRYRPFQSTAEVLTYLPLAKYRTGGFDILVNSGGSLDTGVITGGVNTAYWFRNGTHDSNLVVKIIASGGAETDTTSLSARIDAVNTELDGLNPMSDSGDITYGGTSGAPRRRAVGAEGQIMQVVSGVPNWGSGAPWSGSLVGTNVSSSTSATMPSSSQVHVFTGTSEGTWTLPSLTSKVLIVKNNGEANLIVQRGGSDEIWTSSAVTSVTLAIGEGAIFAGIGGYWTAAIRDRSTYIGLSTGTLTATGAVEFGSTIKFPTGAGDGKFWRSNATGEGSWATLPTFTLAEGTYGEIDVSPGGNMEMNAAGYSNILAYITDNQLLSLEMFNDTMFQDFASGAVGSGQLNAVKGDTVYDYLQTNYGTPSTIGKNILTSTNPSAVTWLRGNADNTATWRTAAQTKSDLAIASSDLTDVANIAFENTTNNFTQGQTVSADLTVTGRVKAPYVNRQLQTLRRLGYNVIAEPINTPFFAVMTNTGLVDGSVRMFALELEKDTTLTGITFFQSVQGVFTADNNNKVGLYSVSGTTATLVASSANNANVFKGTSDSRVSENFTTPYAATAGLYYVVALWNTSANTTTPALFSVTGNTAQQFMGLTNDLSLAYSVASQTDLPATVDLSTATKLNNRIYLSVY